MFPVRSAVAEGSWRIMGTDMFLFSSYTEARNAVILILPKIGTVIILLPSFSPSLFTFLFILGLINKPWDMTYLYTL